MFLSKKPVAGRDSRCVVRAFYVLVEHCEFRDKRDEHPRGRLVVGIKDKEFPDISSLMLAQAVEQVGRAEEIMRQVCLQASKPKAQLSSINAVRRHDSQQKGKGGRLHGGSKIKGGLWEMQEAAEL